MALKLLRSRWSVDELSAARATIDDRFGTTFLSELHGEIITTQACETEQLKATLGIKASDLEFVLRQVCYARFVAHERLNRPILIGASQNRAVVAGIPPKWRRVLVDRGIRVARFRSMLLWGWRATRWGLLGGAVFGYHVARMASPAERGRGNGGSYAYLHTVALENLPIGIKDLPATDIVSWLERRTNFLEGIDTVASAIEAPVVETLEGRRLLRYRHPLAAPSGIRAACRFVRISSGVLFRVTVRLVSGRWQSAILAPMLVQAALLKATEGRGQAKIHLFNSSGAGQRPLWTLLATSFDIRVVCYHYSTNIEAPRPRLDRAAEHIFTADSWRLSWWDQQTAWDQRHREALHERAERTPNISVLGPTSFVATTKRLPRIPARSVAVFDVTPMNGSRQALWASQNYYTIETVQGFILGLIEVAAAQGLTIAWKSKRAVEESHHPDYSPFREMLQRRGDVVVVEPGCSAEQLIAATAATVSIPFTSTALLAKADGKPSAFFDPTGSIASDHGARRGLPLLASKDEIGIWMASIRDSCLRG